MWFESSNDNPHKPNHCWTSNRSANAFLRTMRHLEKPLTWREVWMKKAMNNALQGVAHGRAQWCNERLQLVS